MPITRLVAAQMVLLLVVSALAVTGCGRRGAPEPPPGQPAAEAVPFPDRPDVPEDPEDDFLDPL